MTTIASALGWARNFLRRHMLSAGLFLVLVPLAVIVFAQYNSLGRVRQFWAGYAQTWRTSYLTEVANEVEEFYRTLATEAFDIPAEAFTRADRIAVIERHFASKPRNARQQAARRFFVLPLAEIEDASATPNQARSSRPSVYMLSPEGRLIEVDLQTEGTRAIQQACSPFQMLSREGLAMMNARDLIVFERDPQHRIILKAVTDESLKIVGIVGMIVDEVFLIRELVPQAVASRMANYFPGDAAKGVIASLHDRDEQTLWRTLDDEGQRDPVTIPMRFIFTDWKLELRSRTTTPTEFANNYFRTTMMLTLLTALALLGGVWLALRSAARAMRISQMKTDFVSNVSHELRTPLASIRLFGELMSSGRVRELNKVHEYGEHIESESRRLTQLVNNILDFAKIEGGHKTYAFQTADVREVVAETLKAFEVQSKEMGFSVEVEDAQVTLPLVMIDRDALTQALMNLLDNALKYSGDARNINVRLARDDGKIMISVRDHGVGIPLQEQRKIFDKFHRVSTGLVHDAKGSGLGLAIVKHVVEAHQGKVTVESAQQQGSNFTIHLPIAAPLVGGHSTSAHG